jgi:acyl-CoA thioester hydrolase
MFETNLRLRVRYCETDQMGVVHHGNYAKYFEMGRIEWLRNFGLSYKKMEEDGISLPVVNLNTNFHKPCFYDDELELKTSLEGLPTAKIQFNYKLFRGDILISSGSTILVFVDTVKNKPMRAPEFLYKILERPITT